MAHKCHKWWNRLYLKVVNNHEMTGISKALCSTNYASKNLYANCPQHWTIAVIRCTTISINVTKVSPCSFPQLQHHLRLGIHTINVTKCPGARFSKVPKTFRARN